MLPKRRTFLFLFCQLSLLLLVLPPFGIARCHRGMSDDQGKVGVEKVQKCEEPQNKTGQDEKEQIKDIGDSFKNANEEKKKENDEANSQGQKENKDHETKFQSNKLPSSAKSPSSPSILGWHLLGPDPCSEVSLR